MLSFRKLVGDQDSSRHQTFNQKSPRTMPVNSIIIPDPKKFDYVEPYEFKFEWTVCQRAIVEEGGSLKSEEFSSGADNELKWVLKLYVAGINNDEDDASFHVCFVTSTNNAKVRANLKLSVFDEDGICMAVKETTEAHTFIAGTISTTARFEKFIETDALAGRNFDCFRIVCEIKGVSKIVDIPGKNEAAPLIMPEYRFPDKLRSLFESTKLSDVTLIVSGVPFRAHKLVLAIHSPVFSAMFDHGMVEEIHSEVNITDVASDVFNELLRFMYIGEVSDIERIADFLLVAADKYAIERLKAMCEEALCENMVVENAADILILADRHNADQLKPRALKFIAALTNDVMATSGFQSMIRSHPHLVAEILGAVAAKCNGLQELTLSVNEEDAELNEPMQG